MKKYLYPLYIFIFLSSCFTTSIAQNYSSQEIKAAFICNFAKFTTWPKEKINQEFFIIGIVGADDFGKTIDKIASTVTVNNKPIKVIRYKNHKEAVNAHLIYIGVLNPSINLKELLLLYSKHNILTISERPNFCKLGGVINFSSETIKYGFEINVKYDILTKLILSPKLLKLATLVQ